MANRTRTRINPLDAASARNGRNPRAIAEASRRSMARVGSAMPRGDGRMSPEPRDGRNRDRAVAEHKQELARANPNPRKGRNFADAEGRKGGPGKSRETPKNTRH